MNNSYIKDYKTKEFKLYVTSYLLISVATIALYVRQSIGFAKYVPAALEMLTFDLIASVACTLVYILNDLLPDKAKNKIVYNTLPSDTIFTDIANSKASIPGIDLSIAQERYKALANESGDRQTIEWNKLLATSKSVERGNIIETQRQQLLTRDYCISTVSLLVINILVIVVMAIVLGSTINAFKAFGFPILYLVVMFIITKISANNRAKYFVYMVIKISITNCPDENKSKT